MNIKIVKDKIKVIIFDWERTLHNIKTDTLFDGVPELLLNLSKRYNLIIVSLATSESTEVRKQKIKESEIYGYFSKIFVNDNNKNKMYEEVLSSLNVQLDEILLVDDRVVRGVAWGNSKGIKTVWVKNGEYAKDLPTQETGQPTFTINKITELGDLFNL